MPQLDPTPYISQLFWLGVIFSALYAVIRLYFTPRFVTLFDRRGEALERKLLHAKDLKKEAEDLAASLDEKMKEAHERLRSLVHEAEMEAQKQLLKEKHALAEFHTKELVKVEERLLDMQKHFTHSLEIEKDLTRMVLEQVAPLKLEEALYDRAVENSKGASHVA